ncbi:amidohydrolase [Mycolicibacter heraklionensis]|uniref:Amidohydrolase n=1 Tax=Mycolicibacter heraklionensis TaxID=512402 RepID=A0ABR5FF83_9MYCO|nr:amidohydrolase family protein [Mycolicibacter heraklionensis]KLO28772.1 amidohydrolase [Mycolicibacter heraklionensis]
MPSRKLGFPVFDADNHFYEPKEALTKFLPAERKNTIQYVEVNGRTKIVVRNVISDYIPNPTFDVVARPGAQEEYYRHGSGGKSYREMMGEPMKAIPAFREPGPRLEVMDELGIDYALMFPTLASLVEERMKDDPELIHDVIHALNTWMYETWSFNYADRIFATPVITLPIVDRALEELEWCLERGARTVLVRPAPVPGYKGSRSFGLPEFDPFWQACIRADIPVSMHASDSGYAELLNIWEPGNEFLPFRPTAFRMAAMGKRPIEDAMLALVCHGALSRNPELRVLSIENGADWVPHVFHALTNVYKKMPESFLEDPVEAFKRCVYISPFWEENFAKLAKLVGTDRVVFGSDWPHPEGLKDPITFVDDLAGLDQSDIEKIMGGNMMKLLKVTKTVPA